MKTKADYDREKTEEVEKKKVALSKLEPTVKKDSMVEHPSHYADGKYECIDVIEDLLSRKPITPFQGGLWLCAFKYLWRVGEKHGDSVDARTDKEKIIQDLKKSVWYTNKLIENLEKN